MTNPDTTKKCDSAPGGIRTPVIGYPWPFIGLERPR